MFAFGASRFWYLSYCSRQCEYALISQQFSCVPWGRKKTDHSALIAGIADHFGIFDGYSFLRRKLTGASVAVVLYHRVCPQEEGFYPLSISPEAFEIHIDHICRNYEVLSLDSLAELVYSESLPSTASVVLTFDDGYRDNYLYAYPIIKKYDIPATIFLATGYLDGYVDPGKGFWSQKVWYAVRKTSIRQLNLGGLGTYSIHSEKAKRRAIIAIVDRLRGLRDDDARTKAIQRLVELCQVDGYPHNVALSWNEVREMSGNVTFGAHTVNHRILTRLPLDQARNEITESKRRIEKELDREATTFSYPNGEFSPEIVKLVREAGFKCAVSVLPRRPVCRRDSIYSLPRILVQEDLGRSKLMLCGLWADFLRARQKVNRNQLV